MFQIADLQKKIAAAAARLKQQQNLYEAVRGDRNVYSKNLIETQVRRCRLNLPLSILFLPVRCFARSC